MKNVILVSTLISGLLFFSVLSIFGIEYQGINESPSFAIFCIALAALSILVILIDFFPLKKFSLNGSTIIFLLLPVFISLFFFAEQTSSELALTQFRNYLVFSLSSTYIGIYVARRRWLAHIAKWFEIVMIIFSVSIMVSLIVPFFNNEEFSSFAGSSYQTASYISAFAYSLNLFFLLFGNRYELFKFHYFKIYKILMYILLPVQITGVLVSTGRGGFVVVFVSTIVFLWLKGKDQKEGIKNVLMIILFLTLSGLIFLPRLIHNELFLSSSGRVFSYISGSGIDMSQTSGRERVFSNAIKLIKDRPFTGYGMFGYYDFIDDYPHNIFLEVLLNGGILYLLFTLLIGFLFFKKLKLLIKQEPENLFVLAIFIYPITELMFTGTYISTSLFWFVISYVFCYSVQINEVNKKNIGVRYNVPH